MPPPRDAVRRPMTQPQRSATLVATLTLLATLPAVAWWQRKVPIPDTATAAIHAETLASRIDPNTATAAELTVLPGIGPAKADRIVAYRRSHADPNDPAAPVFTRPADLERVHGIGPKTVARLRPHLTFAE